MIISRWNAGLTIIRRQRRRDLLILAVLLGCIAGSTFLAPAGAAAFMRGMRGAHHDASNSQETAGTLPLLTVDNGSRLYLAYHGVCNGGL
jgi:hypothetical protein